MKILFLTLAKIDSIEERAIYPDLLRKFRDEGHSVTIMTPIERRYNLNSNCKIENGCKIIKIKTLNVQKVNFFEKIIGILSINFLYTIGYNRFLKNERFDLIMYTTPPITLNKLISKLKLLNNTFTYLLLKDIFPQNAVDLKMFSKKSLIYRYFRQKEVRLYEISDFIGCMSENNKKYIIEHNPNINKNKIDINPNSVFLEPRNEKNEIKSFEFLPKDKIILVYGGNLGKPQGIDFLLDIINELKSNNKIFFVIIGSGTESKRIENWIKNNQIDNAILIKTLPHADYNSLLKQCHIGLVFLSPEFTIPNYPSRILAYMENKLPILFGVDKYTDVGTDAEAGNYGLNCINGDLITFCKNIDLLVLDSELRKKMGLNGYERLKKDFNVNYSYNVIMNHF
jgi:glycosyltransferase involved in cell wall biosynthesis